MHRNLSGNTEERACLPRSKRFQPLTLILLSRLDSSTLLIADSLADCASEDKPRLVLLPTFAAHVGTPGLIR
jgi:hypothetical protein